MFLKCLFYDPIEQCGMCAKFSNRDESPENDQINDTTGGWDFFFPL